METLTLVPGALELRVPGFGMRLCAEGVHDLLYPDTPNTCLHGLTVPVARAEHRAICRQCGEVL